MARRRKLGLPEVSIHRVLLHFIGRGKGVWGRGVRVVGIGFQGLEL